MRFLTLLAATAILVLPCHLPATNRYVASTGNDLNPGTFSSPYKTLGKALSVYLPGDIILVRGGSYPLPAGSGFIYKAVVQPYPGEAVQLQGVGTSFLLSDALAFWTDRPITRPDVRIQLKAGGKLQSYRIDRRRGDTSTVMYCTVNKSTVVE